MHRSIHQFRSLHYFVIKSFKRFWRKFSSYSDYSSKSRTSSQPTACVSLTFLISLHYFLFVKYCTKKSAFMMLTSQYPLSFVILLWISALLRFFGIFWMFFQARIEVKLKPINSLAYILIWHLRKYIGTIIF